MGAAGEQIDTFSKSDYVAVYVKARMWHNEWWRGAKPAFSGDAVAAQTGLLGGREGTHQCTRSWLTENLVNSSTVAKRVAH